MSIMEDLSPVTDIFNREDVVHDIHGVGRVDEGQHTQGDELVPTEPSELAQYSVQLDRIIGTVLVALSCFLGGHVTTFFDS